MPIAPPKLVTLLDHLDNAVGAYRDQPCLVLPDAAFTFGEVDRLASAAAHVLLDRGIREGGVVMSLCNNGAAIVSTSKGHFTINSNIVMTADLYAGTAGSSRWVSRF